MSGAHYRSANPRRVTAPELVACSAVARVVYLHLLVGEVATNLPGLVKVGAFGLADETQFSPELVTKALDELVAARLAEVDAVARLIRLPGVAQDFARQAENPNTVTGWVNSLLLLPQSLLVERQIVELRAICPARLTLVWRPLDDRTASGRQSIATRTKDQDQDLLNPPNPPAGGDHDPDDGCADAEDPLGPDMLGEVLDSLAVERGRLTGVPGPAAAPSPRERKSWEKFCREVRASRADVLRAVVRAGEAMRRRGQTSGLTLAHLLRNWERLRDAHDLDDPVVHVRAPPSPRVLAPPNNPDLFADA